MVPVWVCALALALLLPPSSSWAQPVRPTESRPAGTRAGPATPEPGDERKLPPDVITHHVVDFPGHSLAFTATAGSFLIADGEGKPQARISYFAYTLDGQDGHARPVTFVTNGGPGTASAWLHLGALGPWRLPMDGAARTPSAPPVPMPNAESWLDFTDLVFIDPAGTGWSRLLDDSETGRRRVWSVGGDINILAETIRRWLVGAGRLTSPKYFAGESYGGFRGPRIARVLADDQGIGLSGIVLISPVLNIGSDNSALSVLGFAANLPTMAAVAHHLPPDKLTDVEAFATGDYLQFLLHGGQDDAAVAAVSERVAEFTGLDPALIRRHRGRVQTGLFLREHDAASAGFDSAYDATMSMPNPFPEGVFPEIPDPTFAQFGPPMSSAITDLVTTKLNWHPDGLYHLSNNRILRDWDWGRGYNRPESMSALRTDLATDPNFRVLIGHGVYDLVTTYYTTKLLLAQLPNAAMTSRVTLALHEGGHMFYTHDASRAALHDEARALIAGQ